MLIKFLLNGKEINLTGDNTVIKSNNFNVDKNGNMTCNNATLQRGELNFYTKSDKQIAKFANSTWTDTSTGVSGEGLTLTIDENTVPTFSIWFSNKTWNFAPKGVPAMTVQLLPNGKISSMTSSSGYLRQVSIPTVETNVITTNAIEPKGGAITYPNNLISFPTGISCTGTVFASNFVNSSEEHLKENIKKFAENEEKKAIDILKGTDIYQYNFKGVKQKTIGVVIGEKYNTPEEILSYDKKGIDLYSMVSVCWKAIQEQQEIVESQSREIESLNKRIEDLERKENNND